MKWGSRVLDPTLMNAFRINAFPENPNDPRDKYFPASGPGLRASLPPTIIDNRNMRDRKGRRRLSRERRTRQKQERASGKTHDRVDHKQDSLFSARR